MTMALAEVLAYELGERTDSIAACVGRRCLRTLWILVVLLKLILEAEGVCWLLCLLLSVLVVSLARLVAWVAGTVPRSS